MRILLFLLLSVSGFSQVYQTNNSPFNFIRGIKQDTIAVIPRGCDTVALPRLKFGAPTIGALYYDTCANTLYVKGTFGWNPVTGGVDSLNFLPVIDSTGNASFRVLYAQGNKIVGSATMRFDTASNTFIAEKITARQGLFDTLYINDPPEIVANYDPSTDADNFVLLWDATTGKVKQAEWAASGGGSYVAGKGIKIDGDTSIQWADTATENLTMELNGNALYFLESASGNLFYIGDDDVIIGRNNSPVITFPEGQNRIRLRADSITLPAYTPTAPSKAQYKVVMMDSASYSLVTISPDSLGGSGGDTTGLGSLYIRNTTTQEDKRLNVKAGTFDSLNVDGRTRLNTSLTGILRADAGVVSNTNVDAELWKVGGNDFSATPSTAPFLGANNLGTGGGGTSFNIGRNGATYMELKNGPNVFFNANPIVNSILGNGNRITLSGQGANGALNIGGSTATTTAADMNYMQLTGNSTYASGAFQHSAFKINYTWNQTGTASGAIVGIDYNPTVTNNVSGKHYGLLVRSGRVGIGNAAPDSTLHITGGLRYEHPTAGAGKVLTSDATGGASWQSVGGVTTLSAIGATPNANGATITGTTLNLQPASASFGGVVTTGTQTFAGEKRFSDGTNTGVILYVRNDSLNGGTFATYTTGNTRYTGQAMFNSANDYVGGLQYGDVSVSNSWMRNALLIGPRTSTADLLFISRSTGFGQAIMDQDGLWGFQHGALSTQPTISTSALITMNSTSKGFLPPRMTGAQMNAISTPATGLMVYNTDSVGYTYYTGSAWAKVGGSGGATGITSLNGLTGATQTFTTGTTGTDFGISSTGTTHTFNLPTASAVNRGALSTADWSTFNNKQPAIDTLTSTLLADVAMTTAGTIYNGPAITLPAGTWLLMAMAVFNGTTGAINYRMYVDNGAAISGEQSVANVGGARTATINGVNIVSPASSTTYTMKVYATQNTCTLQALTPSIGIPATRLVAIKIK